MALIYFAYKVLTFQFCEIFCMNGNKSSLLSSPQILGNYFARRKILAETFELSVSAKFPLSWIPPKVRACKNEDKHISQDLAVSVIFSCEDAALQVLMSVCVCVSVVNLKIHLPTSF